MNKKKTILFILSLSHYDEMLITQVRVKIVRKIDRARSFRPYKIWHTYAIPYSGDKFFAIFLTTI